MGLLILRGSFYCTAEEYSEIHSHRLNSPVIKEEKYVLIRKSNGTSQKDFIHNKNWIYWTTCNLRLFYFLFVTLILIQIVITEHCDRNSLFRIRCHKLPVCTEYNFLFSDLLSLSQLSVAHPYFSTVNSAKPLLENRAAITRNQTFTSTY